MFETLLLSLALLMQVENGGEQDVEAIIKEPGPAAQVRPEEELDPVPFSPEKESELVLQFLQTQVPAERRPMQRFVSFYALPPEWRGPAGTTLSFVLNSLHFNPIVRPEPVAGTKYRLWTFNLLDWCRPNSNDVERYWQVWEDITAQDPYFREPWVNSEVAAKLRIESTSSGCVVRGDWLMVKVTDDDDPATKDVVEGFYTQLMGFPETEAEFQQYIEVNINQTEKNGAARSAGVLDSGRGSGADVALHNRLLRRIPTLGTALGGYYWRTFDVVNSQGEKNVLNHPLGIDHDGGEQIFSLPNGLQGYYLIGDQQEDGSRKRVSAVPPNIATDPNYPDAQVSTWHSCATCHVHGILMPDMAVRELVSGGNVNFVAFNNDDQIKFNTDYQVDLAYIVEHDQKMFEEAIKRASGAQTTPEEVIANFKKIYLFYEWTDVTPFQAAREWGIKPEDLEDYLANKRVQTTQGALLMLLRGRGIKRDMFEEEYKNGKLLRNIQEVPNGKTKVTSKYSRKPETQAAKPAPTLAPLTRSTLSPEIAEIVNRRRQEQEQEQSTAPEPTPEPETPVDTTPVNPDAKYGTANRAQIVLSGTEEVGRTEVGGRYEVLETVSYQGGQWARIRLNDGKVGHVRAETIDMEE